MRIARAAFFLGCILGGSALLAAACAPAAKAPAATSETGSTQTKKEAPAPETQAKQPVIAEQPAPSAAQSAPKQPEQGKPASVSGIPLDPDAKMGGVLTLSTTTEGPTRNPWEEAAGNSFQLSHPLTNQIVQFQTWGTVAEYERGAYWNIQPDLAKSWEQSSDGMKWTIKFRDGVKWSDGTPFTCADAKFTLDSIRTGQDLRRSPRAIHLLPIKDIQCADALTMAINMKRPKPGLIEMIAMPYNVVWPAKYAGKMDTVRDTVDRAGTGPFTLKESVPGEKHTFVRKADYWDKPFPYLDGIEVRILSTQALVSGMRAGRINLGTFGTNGATAENLIKECDLCQAWPRNVNVSIAGVIHVNHQRAPWNTPEVKEAISLAYDRARYNQVNNVGWGLMPVCGPFHPGTQWCPESWQKRVAQIPGYDFSDPAKNKEKARALLTKAGYKPGELTINFRWWQSGNAGAPVSIKEDLDAIGITATLEELQTTRAYDSLSAGEFNVQFHGFFIAGTDADVPLYEHFYTGSDRNYGRYSNPQVDRLIDEMSQTVDPELRRQRAWDAAEIILRDQAKIIGQYGVYAPIFSKKVRGIMPAPLTLNSYGNNNRHDHTWLTEK